MTKLTKSDFLNYLECPRELWLAKHHPDKTEFSISSDILFRARQGYEVEQKAKEMLSRRKDNEYIFSKSVETGRLIARFDVFVEDVGGDGASIYEIKSSKFRAADDLLGKQTRETHLYDLAFQVLAGREYGLTISRAFLVTLNGEYVRNDELDLERLFVVEDVTQEIEELQEDVRAKIKNAFELLDSEPQGFENLCSDKLKCRYFQFTKPDLPEWTIFDISRLHKDKKSSLLEMGVLNLFDVPEDFPLSKLQREFIEFVKDGKLLIDKTAIAERLHSLEYPLYFLDYETVNPAIPEFKGMRPLEQITFQHSLHVKESPESDITHHEFLSDGTGVPPHDVAAHLASVIGEKGSVLVWYKPFEMGRNIEMARLFPEYQDFFSSVNGRIFDLYEIFSQKLYRDPRLRSNSLKAVLPNLIPDLTYLNLDIGNGGEALSRWYEDVYRGNDEAKKIQTMNSLREYCELDTLAMVRILDYLFDLVSD